MLTKSFKAGDKVLAEGTFGEETFRIQSGTVLICKEVGRNEQVILAELAMGEVFGEMCMIENSGFRSASAVAKTDVTLEIIPRRDIEAQLAQTPKIIQDILTSVNKRLEGTSQNFSLVSNRRLKTERIVNKVAMVFLAGVLLFQVIIFMQRLGCE